MGRTAVLLFYCSTAWLGGPKLLNNLSPAEIAWVAGILEGEGTFCKSGSAHARIKCRIEMRSRDADVINTLRRLTGVGVFGEVRRKRQPQHSPQFYWVVTRRDDIEALLLALLPHMHTRRAEQMRLVLAGVAALRS